MLVAGCASYVAITNQAMSGTIALNNKEHERWLTSWK